MVKNRDQHRLGIVDTPDDNKLNVCVNEATMTRGHPKVS